MPRRTPDALSPPGPSEEWTRVLAKSEREASRMARPLVRLRRRASSQTLIQPRNNSLTLEI